MAKKTFSNRAMSISGPARSLAPVAPSDTAMLPGGLTRAVFVGGAGDLVVQDPDGGVVTLASASHQYHPIQIGKVFATGTTATGIVVLY